MQLEINKDTCIGCELCVSLCTDTFEMDDDGKAKVLRQPPADSIPETDCAIQAAQDCPTEAILVTEAAPAQEAPSPTM